MPTALLLQPTPNAVLYVEPCQPGEQLPDLTLEELLGPVLRAWNSCRARWASIGPDAAREPDRVCLRADRRDCDLLEPFRWHLAEEMPAGPGAAGELRPWAVEFPAGERLVRRRFWFASRYPVPPGRP